MAGALFLRASGSGAATRLLARIGQPAIVLDPELALTGWNQAAASLFGLDEGRDAGRRLGEVVLAPDQVDAWRRALPEGGGQVFEHVAQGGGALRAAWHCEPLAGEGDPPSGWLCLATPVPGAPAPGPSLDERVLRALLDSMSLSVWAVDRSGNYVFHDGHGLDELGVKRRSWLGLNMWEIWKGVEGTRETLSQVKAALEEGRATHAAAEAMDRYWESWCVPSRDERGEIDMVVSATLDVTQYKSVEAELREKLALVERQQEIIHLLATPILQVWDGVLAAPLVGVLDSTRAADLMRDLLVRITGQSARYALLDLTGVDVVDTKTAAYLMSLVRAIKLLGAEAIITGIRPGVAQTIVSLGVDLTDIPTRSNLRQGLELCLSRLASERRAQKPRSGRG